MVRTRLVWTAWLLVAIFGWPQLAGAQTLAQFRLTRGWATFGFAAPAGAVPATSGLKAGSWPTQTDVKSRWPDGTLRFAVVTVQVGGDGVVPIVPAAHVAGGFNPTWPAAQVRFSIGGTVYTAALPSFDGSDAWLGGALVREARRVVAPAAGGSAHPLLQVIFDVRSYADGGHRVDICVQNTRDVAAMDMVPYDVAIVIDGQTVFAKSGVRHYSYTRWRKTFARNLAESEVTPDFEPYYRANVLPRYLTSISNPNYDPTGPAYEINEFGAMNPFQPEAGARPELAPFPAWTAQYLVHKRPSQRAMMLKNGDLSGSWSHFLAGPDGLGLIRLSDRPNFWFDHRSDAADRPAAPLVNHASLGTQAFRGIRDVVGPIYPRTDAEHFPSVAYVPYIVTGDRFYLDHLKLWANNMVLKAWPAPGVTRDGIDVSRGGGNGVMAYYWGGGSGGRGWAWPLREIIAAASACPDDDPDLPYLRDLVVKNLEWAGPYLAKADTSGVSEAVGWEGDEQHGDRLLVSLWQSSYLAWTIDWAERQGFALGASRNFRDRMIRSQIKFLTSGASGYASEYGAPYYVQVGRRVGGVPQLFRTWAELWSANQSNPEWLPANNRLPPVIVGYYGPEARLQLLMGDRLSLAGARTALAWLDAYRDRDGASVADDVNNNRIGFALAPFVDNTITIRWGSRPTPPTGLVIVP